MKFTNLILQMDNLLYAHHFNLASTNNENSVQIRLRLRFSVCGEYDGLVVEHRTPN